MRRSISEQFGSALIGLMSKESREKLVGHTHPEKSPALRNALVRADETNRVSFRDLGRSICQALISLGKPQRP